MLQEMEIETSVCEGCNLVRKVGALRPLGSSLILWLCAPCLGKAIKVIDSKYKLPTNREYTVDFDFKTMKFVGLEMPQIKRWEKKYPLTDISIELQKMVQ